jgi:hypothetical protein
MNTQDFQTLGKKIAVGILVYLIPLAIIAGGLCFTNYLFKKKNENQTLPNPYPYESRNR